MISLKNMICRFAWARYLHPQPRVGGLSVAKTEKIRRKSRSEASKRGWATKLACKWSSYGICLVYTWHIPVISLVYPVRQLIMPFECYQAWKVASLGETTGLVSSSCPENPCSVHVFPIHPVLIAPVKPCKTKGSLKQVYVTYIPWIYMVYVMYIPGMFCAYFWMRIMLSNTLLASTLYCPQPWLWYAALNYA